MPSAYAETKKDKEKGVREDIGGLMAELSKRPTTPERIRKLTGPERAAVLMLSLGTIEAESVEQLLLEFVGRMSASGALLGNYDATERLLKQYLPAERVGGIMDE